MNALDGVDNKTAIERDTLFFICRNCPRMGRYCKQTLIAQFGTEVATPDLLPCRLPGGVVSWRSSRRQFGVNISNRWCGVHYDLAKMSPK
jgi:hypothetical protein